MEEKKLLKKKSRYLKENNKQLLASVCNDLAELYLREGKYAQSIDEYKVEAKIYKESNQDIQHAQVNRMIGEVYFTMGQFEKALSFQQIHLAVAKQNNNKLEEQRALATIGRTYLTSAIDDPDVVDPQNLNLAYKAFKKSLIICESLRDITKREQMDMRSRLLLNIGVVYENQGKYDSAIEYMTQAIKICKSNDIFDQLHQSYSTLGLLYSKRNEYSKALSVLNLAFEVAKRLSDKIPPMVATLVAKAEIFYKVADFQNAKQVLLKAYKLKSPNKEERALIERSLKVVAALSYTEDSLLTTADSDFKLKKKLYEKMGDGACELKIFNKAIDYYKKMLEYSELNGECGKDLIPVYVSLAQTYKDNKQYDLALEYFQKEYQICCDNPKESHNTLLNIAEVMELQKTDYEEIKDIYEKAKIDAHSTGVTKIEGKVILRYITFLKKYNKFSEAGELEKNLRLIDYVQSDSEEDSESGTPNIGDDIAVSDISDMSEGSDTEGVDNAKRTRRRGQGYTFKKNSKGETPLHVACISGNVKLVQRLLEQGHLVNVRDNCGWLPIHEACNYGYIEIIKLLVEKGANVNDRGGPGCKGMTPIHDACCNGHLEVIEYLLDCNASVLAQNDSGETPLDILKNYREQTTLEPIEQTYFETIFARMTKILEKAGRNAPNVNKNKQINTPHKVMSPKQKDNFSKPKKSPSYNKISPSLSKNKSIHSSRSSIDSDDSYKNKIKSPRNQPIGTLRHIIDNGSSDEDEPMLSAKERLKNRTAEVTNSLNISDDDSTSNDSTKNYKITAKDEYKRVMQSLRSRLPETITKSTHYTAEQVKGSAYITEKDVGDNWLDDDININRPTKKRKFGNEIKETFVNTSTRKSISPIKRLSDSSNRMNPSNSFTEKKNSFCDENDIQIITSEFDEPLIFDNSNDSFSSNSSFKRKKSQSLLFESGFSRQCISPETTYRQTGSFSINRSFKRQQKISSFTVPSEILEPDSTTTFVESNIISPTPVITIPNRSMCAISVRIEGKLWRVPVLANEIENLTIGWLANEAAKRYNSKEGILPNLQLEARDGAILVNEDPLNIIFITPTQAEEIQSSIISWNLPPLPERYLEACHILKTEVDKKLHEKLNETNGTLNLNLTNFSLQKQIAPLFRALNRETDLQIINLTNTYLLNEGIQQLTQYLPSFSQLKSLHLTLNNINLEGLRYLSEIFTNAQKPVLENLDDLNLSYNLIGDECLRHLETISKYTKLRILNLSGCNFTDKCFDSNNFINLNFEYLESFDISYNDLNKNSICKFLTFLNFNHISVLNLSHNNVTESGILKEIVFNLQHGANYLRFLNLGKCKINDAEIWDFLRLLTTENNLETLDLSYNDELTSVTLRRLIQHIQPPTNLNFEGCDNILQYFSEEDDIWSFDKTFPISSLRSLKLSCDFNENSKKCDALTRIWEQEWGRKAKIIKLFNSFLTLSVVD